MGCVETSIVVGLLWLLLYVGLPPGPVGCQSLPHAEVAGPLVGMAKSQGGWLLGLGGPRSDAH